MYFCVCIINGCVCVCLCTIYNKLFLNVQLFLQFSLSRTILAPWKGDTRTQHLAFVVFYKNLHLLFFVGSGGSKAAKIASSNTFFSPFCKIEK